MHPGPTWRAASCASCHPRSAFRSMHTFSTAPPPRSSWVHDVDTQVDSSLKPLIPRYRFSPDCSLAATCRAIRIESADTMWRNVFVKAGHHWTTKRGPCGALPLRAPITLEMLNSVLPDAIAQHITRLTNVLLPENGDATTCLLKYP